MQAQANTFLSYNMNRERGLMQVRRLLHEFSAEGEEEPNDPG